MGALPPIMLVDDDPDDLFIMQRLLTKAGVENKTVAFEDPRAALDHLEREIPNMDARYVPCVVFCDLQMPELSGFDVVMWIRAHPTFSEMPVIIHSHSSSPDDEKRALELGATRFLQKYPTSAGLKQLIPKLGCNNLALRD